MSTQWPRKGSNSIEWAVWPFCVWRQKCWIKDAFTQTVADFEHQNIKNRRASSIGCSNTSIFFHCILTGKKNVGSNLIGFHRSTSGQATRRQTIKRTSTLLKLNFMYNRHASAPVSIALIAHFCRIRSLSDVHTNVNHDNGGRIILKFVRYPISPCLSITQ